MASLRLSMVSGALFFGVALPLWHLLGLLHQDYGVAMQYTRQELAQSIFQVSYRVL